LAFFDWFRTFKQLISVTCKLQQVFSGQIVLFIGNVQLGSFINDLTLLSTVLFPLFLVLILSNSPTALKFVSAILLPKYGWPHKENGQKYPTTEMSFRQTIGCLGRSDRGFMVKVDREERKVLISFDAEAISPRHAEWLKGVQEKAGLEELNPQPYWGFEDLERKTGAKLNNCFFVQAAVKKSDGKEFYNYERAMMLKGFDFEGFLQCLENGTILVDFDARTGHNHGTKFRIRQNSWPLLYREKILLF
jgi:hypothetical protein